jgi:hypothetical protein
MSRCCVDASACTENTHTHTHIHTHRKLSVTVGRVDVVAIDYGELADA